MEEFKSPLLVTGTFTPSGTQDVNVVSPNPLPVSGTLTITPTQVLTSVVSRVASSISSQTLVSVNADRKGLIFYNDSTINQYIKFGITATTVDFTVILTSHMIYEVQTPVYDGRIDFISSSATGAIQVTELS